MTKRVVIKIGTQVITDSSGHLNTSIIKSITNQLVILKQKKIDVILVSSGAMAAGRQLMSFSHPVSTIIKRQMLSAVGQVKLIETYSKALSKDDIHTAQVLTCKEDFRDRHHYLNMKNCFEALLHENIIPIVNENEVIAIDELMFTDNDELAGLIGAMMNVDTVMILTSVDGVFDRSPKDPEAKLISEIDPKEPLSLNIITSEKTPFGRGGMQTKLRIANKLSNVGITTYIANGKEKNAIVSALVDGKKVGTKIIAKKRVSNLKKWIAHSLGLEKGKVRINACAEDLLTKDSQARSLLPVGITKIEGTFDKGDVIAISNEKGKVLGIGIAQYSSTLAKKYLGQKRKRPLIHYDYLYIGNL